MQEPITAGFQLSLQQKRLWSWQGDGQLAVAQVALRLEGKLDVQRLKDALQKIVERHEMLRTTFQRSSGMKFPFQVVNVSAALSWEQVDLSGPLDKATEKIRIEELFAACAEIDQERGPALHACLAMVSGDRQVLVLSLPALCADAATLTNLAEELFRLYANVTQNVAAPLQYADYSEWQKELLQKNDDEAREGKEYWVRHDFTSIPNLPLPFEHKREGNVPFLPDSVPVLLDGQLLSQLDGVASGDVAHFLLACWQVLLWRLTGQAEVVIGYVSDGRNHEELASALGLFAKAIPLYANFEPDCSVADVVKQVRQARLEIDEWQDYFPAEHIRSEEHTSELQSLRHLVCRLLLEKK